MMVYISASAQSVPVIILKKDVERMLNTYKFPIAACNRPSQYRTEAQCKTTVMNLARQQIRKMIDKEKAEVLAEDYKFYDWDFKNGVVTAVYNKVIL